jgi:hypothetical protein
MSLVTKPALFRNASLSFWIVTEKPEGKLLNLFKISSVNMVYQYIIVEAKDTVMGLTWLVSTMELRLIY